MNLFISILAAICIYPFMEFDVSIDRNQFRLSWFFFHLLVLALFLLFRPPSAAEGIETRAENNHTAHDGMNFHQTATMDDTPLLISKFTSTLCPDRFVDNFQ